MRVLYFYFYLDSIPGSTIVHHSLAGPGVKSSRHCAIPPRASTRVLGTSHASSPLSLSTCCALASHLCAPLTSPHLAPPLTITVCVIVPFWYWMLEISGMRSRKCLASLCRSFSLRCSRPDLSLMTNRESTGFTDSNIPHTCSAQTVHSDQRVDRTSESA